MDTKLNGIKYSYGVKITAVFLAAICVFASAWCCVDITKTLHDYGWENLLVREDAEFTDTALFYNEIGEAVADIQSAQLSGTWEEYRTEHYGTLEEEQQYALEAFYQFRKETEEAALSSNSESSQYGMVTNAAGTAEYYFSDRALSYDLHFFPAETVSLRYNQSEESILQLVETRYTARLDKARRSFESTAAIAAGRLSKYENFKYLVVNSTTGEVYSNCNVQTPEAFYALFEPELDWVLGYEVEHGVTYYSKAVSPDVLYSAGLQASQYKILPTVLSETVAAQGYNIYLSVLQPLVENEEDAFYLEEREFSTHVTQLETLLFSAMILLALALIISIYLLLVTGRVRGVAGVKMSVLDRMPTDLHFALSWGLAILGFACVISILDVYVFENGSVYYIRGVSLLCMSIALLCAVIYVVLLEWCTSVAKYQKAKQPYLRAMLMVRFALWSWKLCKRFGNRIKKSIEKIKGALHYKIKHLTKKAWLYVLMYVAANAILAIWLACSEATLFWLLCFLGVNVAALLLIWKYVRSLDQIIDAAEKSKSGEMPADIGAQNMPEPLRSLAQNLSFTQEEMQKAVQEAIKGERMKTELITNVSHDLKTPLTSIISYVDLLKKCDIQDANAQKYISVLDEKSIRLKRLIEDLVEASKASSGAVTLNKMQVNLYELATQAVGEMEDGFTDRNLQLVLNEPKEVPVIFADSQKTWRVIDNLLSNARKYSLAGSRVYVSVERNGNFGIFTVKNVSGEALNIDPDELTQRFVRGDASRTLEGSGLGLSIAKDLCALQGGALKIEIDGDLFKATVSLPLWKTGDLPVAATRQ